jgi:hypothetical protein
MFVGALYSAHPRATCKRFVRVNPQLRGQAAVLRPASISLHKAPLVSFEREAVRINHSKASFETCPELPMRIFCRKDATSA